MLRQIAPTRSVSKHGDGCAASVRGPRNCGSLRLPARRRIGWSRNFWKSGARGRSRTADTAIFSRMLYQLSYPGIMAGRMMYAHPQESAL